MLSSSECVGNTTRKMPQELCEALQRQSAARRTSPSPSPSTAPTLSDSAAGPARNPTGRVWPEAKGGIRNP